MEYLYISHVYCEKCSALFYKKHFFYFAIYRFICSCIEFRVLAILLAQFLFVFD